MALPIRQTLNRLPISRTHRAVLIEVCELAAQKHGACTASNGYLGERLAASERTASRTVCELVAAGLLVEQGRGKARRLTPAGPLLACYSPAENLANLASLNLANLAKQPSQPSQDGAVEGGRNLAKQRTQPSQTAHLNLANPGSQPSQTASRVYGDDQNDQLNDQDDQPAALALAQKKIEGLAFELTEALESLAACRATIVELRADLETEKRKSRATHAAAPVASAAHVSSEFAAIWKDFRVAQGIAANGARERVLLASLAELAANEDEAIAIVTKSVRKGWNDLYKLDEPRPQYPAQNGVAGYGQHLAPAVHANTFGIASPQSIAIAGALAVGSTGNYADLI